MAIAGYSTNWSAVPRDVAVPRHGTVTRMGRDPLRGARASGRTPRDRARSRPPAAARRPTLCAISEAAHVWRPTEKLIRTCSLSRPRSTPGDACLLLLRPPVESEQHDDLRSYERGIEPAEAESHLRTFDPTARSAKCLLHSLPRSVSEQTSKLDLVRRRQKVRMMPH